MHYISASVILLNLVVATDGHPLDISPGIRLYDLYRRASILLPKRVSAVTLGGMAPLYMGHPEYEDENGDVVTSRIRRSADTAGHQWVLSDEDSYEHVVIRPPKRSLGNAMQHYILSRSKLVPVEL
ncbi:hypothetical protein AAVH_43048 [Aphelenchoides avenae]|nr:hypothetical protein AAVH_43048 [Aphelenchus avenae]